MSCRQSKLVTRSYPVPENCWAPATSKLTRSATPASEARLLASCDRAVVVVGAGEGRRRERLGHQHGAGPVAAPDVGHPTALLELGLGAVEGRDPLRHQMGEVAGPEELLAAAEDLLVVLVPADTGPGAVGLLHAWHGGERAEGQLERAGQEQWSVGVGESERLLLGHRVAVVVGVVLDVAAGGLAPEPLGHVAGVGAGPLGELARGGRPGRERAVETETVAEDDIAGRDRRAEVPGELADELHQLVGVDSHGVDSFQRWMLGDTSLGSRVATRLQGAEGTVQIEATSTRGGPMRAREPDRPDTSSATASASPGRCTASCRGPDDPAVLLLPTWCIVPAEVWKLQVPFLARRTRVITFDPRGNGASDRPEHASAYERAQQTQDALDVLDATGTERAVVVGLSMGNLHALDLAADHPRASRGLGRDRAGDPGTSRRSHRSARSRSTGGARTPATTRAGVATTATRGFATIRASSTSSSTSWCRRRTPPS